MKDILLKEVKIRAVNVPLKSPIISHLGTFDSWPYLCVDVVTNNNIVAGLFNDSGAILDLFESK